MSKNSIELSLQDEMRNVGEALKRVTSSIFEGAPGVAPTIKGGRKAAQFTLKIRTSNEKRSLESQARRKILNDIFSNQATEIENVIRRALESVIAGLIGIGNPNIRVYSRALGNAKPQRAFEQEPFAQFIKTKEGAGEIGLPDPTESLRNLQAALLQSITVDVIIRKDGPQVKFSFDQRRLLKLTPHPNRLESGVKGPFFSWLSLVTGPDFVTSGIPGYSLVRVSDIKATLLKSPSLKSGIRSIRRANIAEDLIKASRTRGNAGEFAAIMMSNRAKHGGKSPAETFGGHSTQYQPSAKYKGFWDEFWYRTKLDLGVWTRRVISATIRALLKR